MLLHILLGISLLKQSTPELIIILGMNEDEPSIVCWEFVIDHYIHPFTKMPESEMEDACISIPPSLFLGYNLIQEKLNNDALYSHLVTPLVCLGMDG